MRPYLVSLVMLNLSLHCFGQQYNEDEVCKSDTTIIHRRHHIIKIYVSDTDSIKVITCKKVSKVGWRVDAGVSGYSYSEKTKQWLGNHGGPSIGFFLLYKKFSFGLKFKPWTVNPAKALVFTGDTLTQNSKVNPVKIDYAVSYSIDLKHNLALEPYFGLTDNIFEVINEDELQKTFEIPDSKGVILGISFNKYFKVREFEFFTIFICSGYSFANFARTHEALGQGYFEGTIGIGYKGFFTRHFLKLVY